MGSTDVHSRAIKVHLVVVGQWLRRRDSGGEGRAWWRVVVGGVEGRGHGVGVEHVGVGRIVVHHGRPDGREAEVLLEWAGRAYDGVVVHLECVYGEGHLGLRGREGGRVHRVVERVLVQVGLGLGVGGYHDAVDGRDLGGGLCAPLGWLISMLARL
jgi:hypothetical protein